MTPVKNRIIVVDDEPHQIETVCRGLFLHGYECMGVNSVEEALNLIETNGEFHLLLTDITMPRKSGLVLIDSVRERYPDLPIVVFTGLVSTDEVDEVIKRGIPMLEKPFEPDTLASVIEETIQSFRQTGGQN